MASSDEQTVTKRGRVARALAIPAVSGKVSVLWLVVCFVLSAVLAPMVLRLPRWIEFEIVVGLWWGVWLITLTWLLFQGWHVSDDHAWTPRRSFFSSGQKQKKEGERSNASSESSRSSWMDIFDAWDFDFGEGCGSVLAAIAAILFLFLAAWFLIEFGLPGLAFVLYFCVRGMLARVVNSGGFCRGNLPLALMIAGAWATLYTAPVALAVWLIHVFHAHGGA